MNREKEENQIGWAWHWDWSHLQFSSLVVENFSFYICLGLCYLLTRELWAHRENDRSSNEKGCLSKWLVAISITVWFFCDPPSTSSYDFLLLHGCHTKALVVWIWLNDQSCCFFSREQLRQGHEQEADLMDKDPVKCYCVRKLDCSLCNFGEHNGLVQAQGWSFLSTEVNC